MYDGGTLENVCKFAPILVCNIATLRATAKHAGSIVTLPTISKLMVTAYDREID